jgi:release factor glutamine methyltransferase
MTSRQFREQAKEILQSYFPQQEIEVLCRQLIQSVLEIDNTTYYVNMEEEIPPDKEKELLQSLSRLASGEPLQYILGRTHFMGMELGVAPGVLIPRPETEELVQWILDDCKELKKPLRILDIGTGSGCIAIALKKHLQQATVDALDISKEAKKASLENAKKQEVDISFIETDILSNPLLNKKYHVIVSNPPYVTQSDKKFMQNNVLLYEPESALYVSDEDPLCYYRAIADFSRRHLFSAGKLYLEINERYGKEAQKLLLKTGYSHVLLRKDMQGKDRMVGGTSP